MLRLLAAFASLSFAAGQLSSVTVGLYDSNNTLLGENEVPNSLVLGFTTTNTGGTSATVGLPSGMLSDGQLTIAGARRLEEMDGWGDWEETDAGPRNLNTLTCEAYGTATVSSNSLTVQIRKVGSASDPCDAGSSLQVTLTGGTASFQSAATGSLAFSVNTNADSTPVSISVTVDGSGTYQLSVVGDPITWYKGKKIKFWFPPQQLQPLLETPEMVIWAATFQGPTVDYQWFDRFKVTRKDGSEIVDVSVRRAAAGSNRSHFARGDFNQLKVTINGRSLRSRSQQLFSAGDVKLGVGTRVVNPPRVHHSPVLEFVMVESESISFMVHASHAGAEFPGDFQKQVDNTHLDWISLQMVRPERFAGILPEIWGARPRSPEVEAMLVAPSKQMAVCTE